MGKHAGGRPTKLTPEIVEIVRRLLPTCMYLETAADFAGVSYRSFRNWFRRGARELERLRTKGAKPDPKAAIYVEFFHAYKKALAEAEIHDLAAIKKASQDITAVVDGKTVVVKRGEWQAAAWRLERRNPDKWGRERAELKAMRKEIEELQKLIGTATAGAG